MFCLNVYKKVIACKARPLRSHTVCILTVAVQEVIFSVLSSSVAIFSMFVQSRNDVKDKNHMDAVFLRQILYTMAKLIFT